MNWQVKRLGFVVIFVLDGLYYEFNLIYRRKICIKFQLVQKRMLKWLLR